jgi:6-pyruvoyltetrahydropterin/6-carboxytetrahydropterin synthase
MFNHLNYDSPCKSIHGHSYFGSLTIQVNELNMFGMVIDFAELKPIIKQIHDTFDHKLVLNDTGDTNYHNQLHKHNDIFQMPAGYKSTAEHMCLYIIDFILKPNFLSSYPNIKSVEIELHETENNKATVSYTI